MSLKQMIRNYGRDLTSADLDSWTPEQIKFMAKYNGAASVEVADRAKFGTFLERIKGFLPLSPMSRTLIISRQSDIRRGAILNIANPEQVMWKTGGEVLYTPTTMVLKHSSGAIEEVPNKIIPVKEKVSRPAITPAAVLISTFCKISKGNISYAITGDHFEERWIREGLPFEPAVFKGIKETFQEIFRSTTEAAVGNKSFSKNDLIAEIHRILKAIPLDKYYYLHTYIVCNFLKPFKSKIQRDTRGRTREVITLTLRMHKDQPVVPKSSYVRLQDADIDDSTLKTIQKLGYPGVFLYLGGLAPRIAKFEKNDMQSALAARALASANRGSDKSGGSYLSSHIGFSGLSTDTTRFVQRSISIIGGVLEKLDKHDLVDIAIGSIGNIELIAGSVRHHYANHDGWKILVARTEMAKIRANLREFCITQERSAQGAHYISLKPIPFESQGNLTKSTAESDVKKILKTYKQMSSNWYPDGYSGYTVYTSLFGYFPWKKPLAEGEKEPAESTPLSSKKSVIVERRPKKEHYVYKVGLADQFLGVVSTIKELNGFGWKIEVAYSEQRVTPVEQTSTAQPASSSQAASSAPPNIVKKHPVSVSGSKVPVNYILIPDEQSWYSYVIRDNNLREVWWCVAQPQYSPVSNVIKVPKSGVTMSLDETTGEYTVVPQDTDDYTGPNRKNLDYNDEEDRSEEYIDGDFSDEADDDDEDEQDEESEAESSEEDRPVKVAKKQPKRQVSKEESEDEGEGVEVEKSLKKKSRRVKRDESSEEVEEARPAKRRQNKVKSTEQQADEGVSVSSLVDA